MKRLLTLISILLIGELSIQAQCDATITNPPIQLCITDTPYQLIPAVPGGTWISAGGALSNTGLFDPSMAYLGPNEISYYFGGLNPCDTTISINIIKCIEIVSVYTLCNLFDLTIRIEVTFSQNSPNSILAYQDSIGGAPNGYFINDSVWTSDWFYNGTPYTFAFCENGNPSNNYSLPGFVNCDSWFALYPCEKITNLDGTPNIFGEGTGTWSCLTSSGVSFFPDVTALDVTVIIDQFDTDSLGNEISTEHIFQFITINGLQIDTFHVSVLFSPEPYANAGTDQFICGNETNLQAIIPVNNPNNFGQWSGALNILDINDPGTSIQTNTFGSYDFIWTVSNPDCSSRDTVIIHFLETPVAIAGFNDTTYGNWYELNAAPTNFSGVWTSEAVAIFDDSTSASTITNVTIPQGLNEYTAVFIWTVANEICKDTDSVEILFIDSFLTIEQSEIRHAVLEQNRPNPFSIETTIPYYLPTSSKVSLEIYNLLGVKVMSIESGKKPAGNHSINLQVIDLTPGTYMYVLHTEHNKLIKKMSIL